MSQTHTQHKEQPVAKLVERTIKDPNLLYTVGSSAVQRSTYSAAQQEPQTQAAHIQSCMCTHNNVVVIQGIKTSKHGIVHRMQCKKCYISFLDVTGRKGYLYYRTGFTMCRKGWVEKVVVVMGWGGGGAGKIKYK